MNRERLRALFVWAVALHSASVGAVMVLAPAWTVEFGGFEETAAFFVRQGGVFHLIVAVAYFWEFRRQGTMRLLCLAKGCAVVFLCLEFLTGSAAWAVPLSAVGDGAMLLVALGLGVSGSDREAGVR